MIRERGGSASNVRQAGPWAEKTLADTAEAAANGDRTAATAIKIVKQAKRLGREALRPAMIAIADNWVRDSVAVLPERDEPYRLKAVAELYRDDCRSEIVLQFDGGSLQIRAEEETDEIGFEFHENGFRLPRGYQPVTPLTAAEAKVLTRIVKSNARKGTNGIPSTVPGGGLLKRGLIAGKKLGRHVQYEITTAGRRALASALWNTLIGKNCEWSWVAWNQQGYRDSLMLSFDGAVPTVLLCVMASSIEVLSVTG
ncbi:MAG TPA: DUF6334 family protein [Gemmataceae bacterium]